MTRRLFFLVLSAVGVGLMTTGCASGPAVIVAKTQQTIPLSVDKKTTNVATKVAEEITLLLPPTDQFPGHDWVLALHDARMLRQRSEVESPGSSGGRASIRFVAQRPVNRTVLRFLLVPTPTARAVEPVDVHEVTVNIQP